MTTGFEPQMTTKNSFQGVEQRLFTLCRKNGLDEEASKEIAHSFTRFVLGYLTDEGVAQALVSKGIPKDVAVKIVEMFVAAKKAAASERSIRAKTRSEDSLALGSV